MGNAQAWNRRVAGALGPVNVHRREKPSKSRQWIQRGVWCCSRCSPRLCPQPASLHLCVRALSREFRTGCPWELLYADDLMISAESMEELLVKLKTSKTEMEKKGLRVNMGKTKITVSGMDLDLLKKSGKDPCGVCQKGVGSNAIFCGGCLCWIHKKCSGIKGPLHPDPDFRCARCLGKA